MDYHFKEYFHEFSEDTPSGNFHKVIALHETNDFSWEELTKQAPNLPRPWWELAQLSKEDRKEFLQEFWESKMVYHPDLGEFLESFFSGVDDVGIILTQKKYDDPYEAQIVYSLEGDSGFFRGAPPASESDILEVQSDFPSWILPADFLAFLQIHNGFCKTTDSTGLLGTKNLLSSYEEFQETFNDIDIIYTKNKLPVNHKQLIPFYRSFGMPDYQCFWAEWYPENEMGVVYYSGVTRTVSDISDGGTTVEHLCFPTFTDWLIFYLEPLIAT